MNVFEYLKWRGDLSFDQDGFNEIDAGILADLTYVDFTDVIPSYPSKQKISIKEAGKKLFLVCPKEKRQMGLILPNEILDLIDTASSTNRFGALKASNYINIIDEKKQEQFSAITFITNNNSIIISFRGTDDTFIGWQENVNMLFKFPVPAQISSVEYLEKICSMYPNKKVYITGHSKGGNLAIYSSIYCKDSLKNRIEHVYNFDGPGFKKGVIDKKRLKLIRSKITTVLPEESIIGMLFELASKTIIVSSKVKGLFQHDLLSWEIEGPSFKTVKKIAKKSVEIDKRVSKMLYSLSDEEAMDLANNIYNFYSTIRIQKLLDIKKQRIKALSGVKTINSKNRKLLLTLFIVLFRNGAL